jgi:hypothetical protein
MGVILFLPKQISISILRNGGHWYLGNLSQKSVTLEGYGLDKPDPEMKSINPAY